MKLRLPNKLLAAIMAAAAPVLCSTFSTATLGAAAVAVLSQHAEAFDGPDVDYTGADTVTSSNMNPTLTKDTAITVDAGVTKDTGNIGINGAGYNAKLTANGDNTTLDLGKMTADSVWLTNGRYRINDAVTADTHVFNGVTTVYAGGAQLWFGDNANYTGENAITSNFVLGNALFHENIGSLDYAALRISKTTEINGDVTIDAEGSKIGFQGNNNLTLRGALKGSGNLRLDTYDNSPILYLQGDASEYTGSITVANANITLNFGGGTAETPKTHTIHGINSTGTVDIAANTTLKLLASETQDFTVAVAKLKGEGGTLALGVDVEGPTVVTGGSVTLTSADASDKKTFSQVTVDSGATLLLQDVNANTKSGDQNFKGNLTIGSGATFTVNHTDSLWYSAGASAANTITVLSGGELAFGDKRWTVGANNKIVLAGGTITGQGDGAGALDFYVNNGVLSATEDSTVSAKIRLRNANQTTTFNVAGTKTLTVSGGILGGGNLLKSGAGTLKLSANNHSAGVSGNFTIDEGTLLMGNSLALGKYNYGTNATNRTITVNNNGTLDVGGLEGAQEQAYHITLNGGTLTNSGNNVGSNQRQVIVGATLTADSSINSDKNFGMIAHGYGATELNLGTNTLEKLGTGTFYITHATVSGTGTVKVAGGTLEFGSQDNACTFSDAVTLMTTGGTMKLDINSANSFLLSGGKVSVSGGTFELGANGAAAGGDHFTANFELSGGETKLMTHNGSDGTVKNYDGTLTMTDGAKLTLHDGSAKFNGGISLNGTVNLTANWAKSGMEFAGVLTGTGTVYMRNNGALEGRHSQKFTISGADNAFSGTIVVGQDSSGGKGALTELIVKNGTALQNAVVNLAAGDKAELQLAAENITLAGLNGATGGNIHKGSLETATLTLNPAESGVYTYAGSVQDGISLVKSGSGTQTLSGDLSAFNGDLTVNAGTLTITGTTLPKADEGTRGTLTLNGGTLKVGNTQNSQTSLSSFSAVTMAGGVLSYDNQKDTLHNVTATVGTTSRIYSFDMADTATDKLLLAGTTTLDGNLILHNYWNAAFEVEKLTGAGKLTVTGADGSGNVATTSAQEAVVTINSLDGFTGSLDFDSHATQDGKTSITTVNTGVASVTMNTLSVHHGAQVTVNAVENGVLTGANLKLDGASTLTFNGGSNTFTSMGVADNGTSDANVIVNLTNGALLKVMNKAVFAAHGEKVNISDTSKLNIDYRGLTVESIDGTQTATISVPVGTHADNYYTLDDNGQSVYQIENAKATYSKGGTVTMKHIDSSVCNDGTSELTVSNAANTLVGIEAKSGNVTVKNAASSAATLTSIKAEGGDVLIQSIGAGNALELSALAIDEERTVTALLDAAAFVNETESNVATITIANGGTLTAASGATLNANLKLADGAEMVSHGALTMGCSVTLGGDLVLSVDGDADAAPVAIFNDVESLTLNGYGTDVAMGWYDASKVLNSLTFNNGTTTITGTELGNYVIGYWNGTVSIAEASVPEPATATLSLLALAALAARRRRK